MSESHIDSDSPKKDRDAIENISTNQVLPLT